MEQLTLDFQEIKSLFNEFEWDIGYLSKENMDRSGSAPIKTKFHFTGFDLTSHLHNTAFNGIILAKYTKETNNYSLYEESFSILKSKYPENYFIQTYLNFKEAAILSGIGVRAKNSLIYDRKFGFQCKLCAYMFAPRIINYDDLNPQKGLLNLCDGCDDCIKKCPAEAIHEDWIDARKCDNFIGFANHPQIPSIKWFWYEKMNPDIPREVVESWNCFETSPPFKWGQGVDGFYELDGFVLKKDGIAVQVPHCKECTLQPRCSKSPIFNN
jgi:Pyruvate/2-oxoacid:ferredoxin oxidoreductase delta subunit